MGIKDTIDASERYAKYKSTDDPKQQTQYLVWDKPGIAEDVHTIYDTLMRRLQANNIPVTGDNLEKAFEALHKGFMEMIDTEQNAGMSEQERDLREAMGTDKEMGLDAVEPKKCSEPEQLEGLAELLKGL